VRASPRARHAKSKARLGAYERLLAEERTVKLDRVEIHIPAGPRLGDVVVEAAGVTKGYGDRLLVEDMSFSLPPGGIVGVIGPNGAGKTTLFRMVAGEEEPDDGELKIGDTVEIAYVDQAREDLAPENSVWKEISGGHDARSTRASTSRGSTSRGATSRSASATSPVASGTASTWRSSCARAGTSCSSTSPPTTSTSTRSGRSRTRSPTSPAARR
jgi:ATPase subunit of ABC transporter with duplicated ATPase domains